MKSMLGINGLPFLNLEEEFDLNRLPIIHKEVVRALVLSGRVVASTGMEYSWGTAEKNLYDHQFKDVQFAIDEMDQDERDFYGSLNPIQQQQYLIVAKGAYYPWTRTLSLMDPGDWGRKMDYENNQVTEEAHRLFPETLRVIESLKIFKGVGRICIFGSDPGHHITCHRDKHPEEYLIDDEFIFLSPQGNKKFYIYDEKTKTKYYVDCRVYTFHDCDWHGGEASPYFNYSIRIDGRFTEDFKKKINFGRGHSSQEIFDFQI